MVYERIVDKKRLDFIVNAVKAAIPLSGMVLDIGCGNGIISRHLGSFGFAVTGVDISDKAIAIARQHNRLSNVSFKVIPAEALVADPDRYDAIICSETLEHLDHPGGLLTTAHALLKNNGILIVTVPNGRGPRELLVTRPIQWLRQKDNWVWKLMQRIKRSMGYTGTTVQSAADDLSHRQFFTKSALERLAGDHHFRIVDFRNANFLEQVFPFSLIAKRSLLIQKADCALADRLPHSFSSGFMCVWRKK